MKKDFLKNYWDILILPTLFIIGVPILFKSVSTTIDVKPYLIMLKIISYLIWASLMIILIKTFSTKQGRVIRIIELIVCGGFLIIGLGLGNLLV